MKINIVVVAIVIVAVLAFVYFIVKRNKKDQKKLEQELNERETKPERHEDPQV